MGDDTGFEKKTRGRYTLVSKNLILYFLKATYQQPHYHVRQTIQEAEDSRRG